MKSKSPRDNLKVVKRPPVKNPTFEYSAAVFLPITSRMIEKNTIRMEKNTMKILKSIITQLIIVTMELNSLKILIYAKVFFRDVIMTIIMTILDTYYHVPT